MDPILNPFSPGAGIPPRALVGRDRELEAAAILFGRLSHGNPERGIVLTGLRGAGKTVLLGRMRRLAREQGWMTANLEARTGVDLGAELAAIAADLLQRVDGLARAEAAAAQLRAWLPRLVVGDGVTSIEVAPLPGRLESDVVELVERLGAAAQAAGTGVALFIDELQDAPPAALSALCAALHRAAQEVTPVTLVAAGLPTLPGRLADAKSYAERLFTYPEIGPLPEVAARAAIVEAISGIKLPDGSAPEVEESALDRIVTFADGYPMFLQALGKHSWAAADGPVITLADVRAGEQVAFAELSSDLFRSRWQRATRRQRDYLVALARAGGRARSAATAEAAGFKGAGAAGAVREELIDKGLVYPPRRGEIAFTVPQFDRFVLEHVARTGD